jgi:hypothetical protein
MICLGCAKLDTDKFLAHAKAGIGKCEHEQLTGTFVSIAHHRDCAQFVAADAEVAQKRVEWYDNLGKGK